MKAKGYTKETIRHFGIKKRNFTEFRIGDTIVVSQWIKEGDKKRLQEFQGDVIAQHRNGISSTVMVRKITPSGVAVEKIFPYHSPRIESIEKIRSAKVRRAKLFHIRDRVGRAARLQEKVMTREQKEQMAQMEEARSQTTAAAVTEENK